jgi:hypothetical protein
VEEAAAPSGVAAAAYDPNLKRNIDFSLGGNCVTATVKTIYNQDIGNVILILFDRSGTGAQRFIGASEPTFVSGPQGKVTSVTACFRQQTTCDKTIQADLVVADVLTPALQANVIHPSKFLDYADLQSADCQKKEPKCIERPTDEVNASTAEELPYCTACPEGQVEGEGGRCYTPSCETDQSLCPDACPNLEGLQLEVPEGYRFDEETNACVQLTCDELSEPRTFEGSANKTVTEHPGSTTYNYYFRMNQGNDNARENACENRGGDWLNFIFWPVISNDVCRFEGSDPPGNPGNDMTFLVKIQTGSTPTTYSVSVTGNYTFSGGDSGTYLVEIVYDPSNFVKKSQLVTLECGPAGLKGQLVWQQGDTYNSSPHYSEGDGHVTGSYSLRITQQ